MTENSMADGHAQAHSRPTARAASPDAHGQAALLLAESTLHALLETQVLTLEQVIAVTAAAAEVKVDVADEIGESDARMEHSLRLLTEIKASFETDSEGD